MGAVGTLCFARQRQPTGPPAPQQTLCGLLGYSYGRLHYSDDLSWRADVPGANYG
jgi:hypothetical protein